MLCAALFRPKSRITIQSQLPSPLIFHLRFADVCECARVCVFFFKCTKRKRTRWKIWTPADEMIKAFEEIKKWWWAKRREFTAYFFILFFFVLIKKDGRYTRRQKKLPTFFGELERIFRYTEMLSIYFPNDTGRPAMLYAPVRPEKMIPWKVWKKKCAVAHAITRTDKFWTHNECVRCSAMWFYRFTLLT